MIEAMKIRSVAWNAGFAYGRQQGRDRYMTTDHIATVQEQWMTEDDCYDTDPQIAVEFARGYRAA